MENEHTMNRRNFMKVAAMASLLPLFPNSAFANSKAPYKRSLSFYNIHTGEKLDTTFWADGFYIPEALAEINHILRDHRTDKSAEIDTGLFDLLHELRTNLDSNKPFQIISGYRSPETNAMLRGHSSGVAKKSLHMQGKAIDINLPGRTLSELKRAAVDLKQGGVGYYRDSNFIHVDVGRVRHW